MIRNIRIETKLGNMRKTQSWVVYPAKADGMIMIQCSRRIAAFFDDGTNRGRLSGSHNYPGFHTLSAALGAKEIDVPQEVIDAALAAQPKSGDQIGSVLFVA